MGIKEFQRVYMGLDVGSALLSWFLFNFYIYTFLDPNRLAFSGGFSLEIAEGFKTVAVLLYWLLIYYSTGYYNNVLRKLRLDDFSQTFLVVFWGTCVLYFVFIITGFNYVYKHYFESFLVLFLIQFNLTFIPRVLITSYLIGQGKKGKIKFRAVLIGQVEKIRQVWIDLNYRYEGGGHCFVGYIPINGQESDIPLELEKLGDFKDIHQVVKSKNIDDVIVVLEESNANVYRKIIYELNSSNVVVKVNPELYPMVQKQAIISSLFKFPLLEISRDLLSPWQASLKQLIDILGALTGLILTLPISLFLVIAIKLTSKGPAFYSHERIGRFGKPFRIIKFRSMHSNAEENGPQLSSSYDPRITPIGRFMRRFKLDEIPNFINVLRAEMSLVGPRPERKYYIDQIVKRSPEYTRLLKVKPGVTSWGQVKYGYAENVDEMVRRMRYDLLYIDNMSLYVDFQILARTMLIILRGCARDKK